MTVSKEIIFEIVSRNKTSHKLLSHYITMYWRQIMLGSKYVNTYIGNVCKPTHFMMWNSALFVEMYNYLVTSCKPNLSGGLIVDTFWNKIVLFRLILWHWFRFFNQSQQQCLIKFRANSEFVYCLFNEKTAHLKLQKKTILNLMEKWLIV
jgi:hypothetical protein